MGFDDILLSHLESTMDDTIGMKKGKSKKSIPKCTRCQNHGKKVAVKFHKHECKFRDCVCQRCIRTTNRQLITKVQTAKRRERERIDMLREMRKNQKVNQDEDPDESLTLTIEKDINDSNNSDLPSLGNHTSDILPGLSNRSCNSGSCRTLLEPVVSNVPSLSENLPPLLPHTTSPSAPFLETESNLQQVELLLGYSAGLVQRFHYPWESLSLMYVILKNSRADPEVAIRSIKKANSEIQATAQLKASMLGAPYYYPRYTGYLNSLGNPTYFGQVPYVGMVSPPSAAGLHSLFPYTCSSHAIGGKVPSSPPERPSSYHGGAHFLRIKQAPIHS
ncbi:protein doublesex-like isoform X2 [Phymastichus coffea]|uniref:protein doublesex-like isoform X2 n=1 Tax=Phymastichus coffea TaxID=108790 RepID=UPI00273C8C90|nr:protein doublesex-like isoform X2 [Phymastichus coffea]